MLTELLYYYTLLSKEFLLFSTILISIEMVMPIRTTKAVYLMISFAIHIFKDMRTQLTILGSQIICFLILYATPRFLSIVFGNVSSIAFSTPGDMRTIAQCQMPLLPTVLVLRNSWVHVSPANGCYYGMLWTLTFFFSFYLFFLILYFFSFEFLFLFIDNEEAHDIAVT